MTKRIKKELNASWKITVGLVLIALGLNLFLVPNKIAAGGISGVGVILFHMLGIPVGATMLVLNLVLFLVAFKIIGKTFGARSIVATVLLSVFVDGLYYLLPVHAFTSDLLIAVIFGDLLTGIGMAIVFNQSASTGGTDILAKVLNKYKRIEIGRSLMIVDIGIGAAAGVLLGSVDVGMYSLLAILVNTFTIDAFLVSINVKKQAFIISKEPKKIVQRVFTELNRGATFLESQGAYTGREEQAILCVVSANQINQLIDIVNQEDEEAFVVVSTVNEVRGEGFKALKAPE